MTRQARADRAPALAKDLVCPICCDRKIAFHSDAPFQLGTSAEKTLIFVCSESHTFFVPVCSLRARPSNSKKEDSPSIEALEARAEAARARLRSASQEFGLLKAQLSELQAELRRTHEAMRLAHLQSRVIVAECRQSAQAWAKFCMLVEFGRRAPDKAQALSIQ